MHIKLLDSRTGAQQRTLRMGSTAMLQYEAATLAFSPDSKRLFARGSNSVLVWDLN